MSEFKRFLLIWLLMVISASLFGIGAYFSWGCSVGLFVCVIPDKKLPEVVVRNKKILAAVLVIMMIILFPLR